MRIKFLFGDIKMKTGWDGRIEFCESKNTSGKAAFCEVNLDIFNKVYKMLPPELTNYYNSFYSNIEKYISINNQAHTCENIDVNKGTNAYINEDENFNINIENMLETFPANGHDIYNYVARYGTANFQIQAVMKFDGRLDPEKLLKAIRLSLDAEPIFGCRLIETDPPYWKRLDNIDKVIFCTFEETGNLDESIRRFLESPLDMDKDPMIKLKLISSDSYDTLCLKINHTCCDGTGTKEYLQLLSDIYSSIDQDRGVIIPEPGTRGRKDQDRLFRALGITDPESAWDPQLEVPKTLWTFPWRQGKAGIAHIAICRLPFGHIDVISQYGKTRGATVNDLLLTAFYRAMFEMSQPEYGVPMNLSLTIDLRRYLPDQKTEAIRCFSGGLDTRLARIAGEPFEGTLSRVVSIMNEVKKGRPGLQSAVGLERVEKAIFHETLSYYQDAAKQTTYTSKCLPALSNLGFISKSPLRFGKNTVIDAYITPPAVSPPGILLCIGTYNGVITLTVSYFESQVRGDDINRLLNLIKNELVKECVL